MGGFRHRMLFLGRWAWVLTTLSLLVIFIGGIPLRYQELMTPCYGESCPILTITEAEFEILDEMRLSPEVYAGYHVGLEILVGGLLTLFAAFIFWQKSDSGLGLLVAFIVMLYGLNFMMEADRSFVGQYPLLELPYKSITLLTGLLLLLIFYIFPDGKFVPAWSRWLVIGLGAVMYTDALLRAVFEIPSREISIPTLLAQLVGLAMGLVAQVYRYRYYSNPTQRQQTKWVIYGLVATILAIFIYAFFVELFPPAPGVPRLRFNLGIYSLLAPLIVLFPITFVLSIMRYRLWDIDLIARRTLTYSLLTLLLGGVYVITIVSLQQLVSISGAQPTALTTVISTLLIAALFTPLQTRIQNAIDRRFYRTKYDMQRILARFGDTAREEVDLELLAGSVLQAVEDTIQPDGVSLWINKGT